MITWTSIPTTGGEERYACIAQPSTVRMASQTASESVGWAWIISAISSGKSSAVRPSVYNLFRRKKTEEKKMMEEKKMDFQPFFIMRSHAIAQRSSFGPFA